MDFKIFFAADWDTANLNFLLLLRIIAHDSSKASYS